MQAMIDMLEDMDMGTRENDTQIIPEYASPTMLVKKNSVRDLKPGEYENLSTSEQLSFYRFVPSSLPS